LCPLHGISDYGHAVREAERLAGSCVPVSQPVWYARLFNQGRVNETHYIGDINIMKESKEETGGGPQKYYIGGEYEVRLDKVERSGYAITALVEILKTTEDEQYCKVGDVLSYIAEELLDTVRQLQDSLEVAS